MQSLQFQKWHPVVSMVRPILARKLELQRFETFKASDDRISLDKFKLAFEKYLSRRNLEAGLM
jgi:hypothetical protein